MATQYFGIQREVSEWAYLSGKAYKDPFNEIELDVEFKNGAGKTWRVPTYWAGGQEWRVRFAAPAPGSYSFTTICSDTANASLHGQKGTLKISRYSGSNALLKHGPLRVSANRRHLEHEDGTPFLWLGDTWWMGFTKRLHWPDEFQLLAADRVAKGFSVIQIIAGLYPDMPAFDERGANEAGFPWKKDYSRIRPEYFNMTDLRIQWLVKSGLVPCIVGCWGYFMPWMGVAKLKQHWRNLVARYGAYPVVWCLAGEGKMPYYLSKNKEKDAETQKAGWTEVARYMRKMDPWRHPVTIHPTDHARDQVADDSLLDFDMLQTGHGGVDSIPNTLKNVREEVARKPPMPVVNGEVCYEGIIEGSREEIQRFMFWGCMLSGARGFTYGANGIWQLNRRDKAYGPSPWGGAWGNQPWEDVYKLPGSAHVGLGKRLLERYPWWRLESHNEWMEPHSKEGNDRQPLAAGIPGKLRIIYLPGPVWPWAGKNSPAVQKLEAGITYRARYVDPHNGNEYPLGKIRGKAGKWPLPVTPITQDWLLILEKAGT